MGLMKGWWNCLDSSRRTLSTWQRSPPCDGPGAVLWCTNARAEHTPSHQRNQMQHWWNLPHPWKTCWPTMGDFNHVKRQGHSSLHKFIYSFNDITDNSCQWTQTAVEATDCCESILLGLEDSSGEVGRYICCLRGDTGDSLEESVHLLAPCSPQGWSVSPFWAPTTPVRAESPPLFKGASVPLILLWPGIFLVDTNPPINLRPLFFYSYRPIPQLHTGI